MKRELIRQLVRPEAMVKIKPTYTMGMSPNLKNIPLLAQESFKFGSNFVHYQVKTVMVWMSTSDQFIKLCVQRVIHEAENIVRGLR